MDRFVLGAILPLNIVMLLKAETALSSLQRTVRVEVEQGDRSGG